MTNIFNTIGTSIPRVGGYQEATRYPSYPNTESVLYDDKDDEIVYFRVTDSNGFTRVKRCRCIEEPEQPMETTLNLDTSQFITKQDFNVAMSDIKEGLKDVQRFIQQSANYQTDAEAGTAGYYQQATRPTSEYYYRSSKNKKHYKSSPKQSESNGDVRNDDKN